jgi:hypothetical protein
MKMFEIDFYTGFEQDPELMFIQKSISYEKRLRLWEGYFDTMMHQVKLSQNEPWTSLAYYYHLCLGCWGDEQENWKIPNVQEALSQLQALELSDEDNQTIAAWQTLILFLKEADEENNSVYITRF